MFRFSREYLERVFKPNIYLAGGVADINFRLLSEWGFKNLILDVDNTLSLRGSIRVNTECKKAIMYARDAGYIENIALLSNTIISDSDRVKRVQILGRQLGTELYFCAGLLDKKPKPIGFRTMMEAMGATASDTAVIGDQLMTDTRGGNGVGAFTILVQPLGLDNKITQFNRVMERMILHCLDLEPKPFPSAELMISSKRR
jgi:HAD superfamily phosphatase (TIGR01668 family)